MLLFLYDLMSLILVKYFSFFYSVHYFLLINSFIPATSVVNMSAISPRILGHFHLLLIYLYSYFHNFWTKCPMLIFKQKIIIYCLNDLWPNSKSNHFGRNYFIFVQKTCEGGYQNHFASHFPGSILSPRKSNIIRLLNCSSLSIYSSSALLQRLIIIEDHLSANMRQHSNSIEIK